MAAGRAMVRARTLAALGASLTAGLVALWGGHSAAADAGSAYSFNKSVALPGSGSIGSLAVNPDGSSVVATTPADGSGCVLVSLSRDGSAARLLGRTTGSANCAIASGPVQGGATELAYTAQSGDGTSAGRSTNGGASFTSADTSGPLAMGSMAADPLVNQDGVSTLFLLVRDPGTGLPRSAISTVGGQTYSFSNFLVDPTTLGSGLWEGPGPSIVAGNLVARRDDAGLRLFAAYETPDSAADRASQAAAKTDNLNRVYLAVGTVTPALASTGGAPTVSWADYSVFDAPAGMSLNNTVPSVAVDSAGAVYVGFSDTKHVYVKSDVDGTQWNASAPPTAVDTVAQSLDASLLPTLVAGGSGIVDLAWYGATGGDASQANPASDAHNTWNVYLAQTLDGGSTWTASTVSDQPVHQGSLTQTAGYGVTQGIAQVTGADLIAYAADQAAGTPPSLFATRQCTGSSAVTGNPLVDDCVAPQPATPVLPGSTCPGPQVNDAPGDALDTSAAGSGSNVPSLDITHVQFLPGDSSSEQLTMTLNRLDASLPADITQAIWRVAWTENNNLYYAQAVQNAGGSMSYMAGALNSDGTPGQSYSVQGLEVLGNSGQITFTLPYTAIGNVATGATLSNVNGATYALFTSGANTVATAPQLVDRAPDSGFGADYSLGQQCAPETTLPDVPAAALLPAVAGGVFLIYWFYVRRMRSRRLQVNESASTKDSEGEGS
ncbi:MAG: hypothetical protein JOY80_07545 [Candidatus Dormibacteraeota bacterium]|nr:hypothetical protein [Candidatus Dormibacteraeota bacterium]